MRFPEGLLDYELLDAGDGQRLERWRGRVISRPEPVAIWRRSPTAGWDRAEPVWSRDRELERWPVRYRDLTLLVGPTGGKQMGLFPEQASNWDFIASRIRAAKRPVKLLNLFAYTGGATIAAANAGAAVSHVDASRSFVAWAKSNLIASNLSDRPVRFIVDDAVKFVRREFRRQSLYDAIVLDPPSFGRGPAGEAFSIKQALPSLLDECANVLTADPLFVILNVHTTGLDSADVKALLLTAFAHRFGGRTVVDSIGLKSSSGRIVPCGVTGWWISGT